MKSVGKFNKFYTFLSGAASITALYQFLSLYSIWSWLISGLFLILLASFLLGFFNSLGFIGGKKRNYGFTKDMNLKAVVTLFSALLIEIDVWLYFVVGIHTTILLVYVQAFVIAILAAIKLRQEHTSSAA